MKTDRLIVKLKRVFFRTLIKYSLNPRPVSDPYVTGDGFRALADHIYDDQSRNFRPLAVKEKDIVFLGNSRIKEFLNSFHKEIKNRYILVSQNGDENIDDEAVRLIDDKIIRWFGINVIVKHPKVVPLPIGIENKHWYLNGIPSIFDKIRKKTFVKKNKIFYAFTVGSNKKERQPALDAMVKCPTGETLKQWMTFAPYLELLATYKFTASPIGSSIEGIRNWDALYIKTIPIVKRTVTTEYFESLDIPIWNIDEWNELISLTEDDLEKKYDEMMAKADWSKIYMDYWKNEILKSKS
jgi:hypothetical protein